MGLNELLRKPSFSPPAPRQGLPALVPEVLESPLTGGFSLQISTVTSSAGFIPAVAPNWSSSTLLSSARLAELPEHSLNVAVCQMGEAEAHQLLREALRQGNLRFSERLARALSSRTLLSAELKRLVASLAPTTVSASQGPFLTDDSEANKRWCTQHQASYAGRWVALRQGQLLASSSSLKGLRQSLSDEVRRGGPPLILHLPEC